MHVCARGIWLYPYASPPAVCRDQIVSPESTAFHRCLCRVIPPRCSGDIVASLCQWEGISRAWGWLRPLTGLPKPLRNYAIRTLPPQWGGSDTPAVSRTHRRQAVCCGDGDARLTLEWRRSQICVAGSYA